MKWNRLALLAAVALWIAVGTAQADDSIRFDYQGRILVDGAPFQGTGFVKIAIVTATGGVTLWSNDSTSVAGSEPSASIPVTVTNGIFDITAGDPALGMSPISGALFNNRNDQRLRIWFNDGTNGFSILTPDREIPNSNAFMLREATQDLTIYVNGSTGNDLNSGLSLAQPKETIQSAVDMAPKSMRSKVTVKIANGIYSESVAIDGFTGGSRGGLTLEGDASTSVSQSIDPQVRLSDLGGVALNVSSSKNVTISGIQADGCGTGFNVDDSTATFKNCKAKSNAGVGFELGNSNFISLLDTWSVNNGSAGFRATSVANLRFTRCGATGNTQMGIYLVQRTTASFLVSGTFSNNHFDGITNYLNSSASFFSPYSGSISGNSGFGIRTRYSSITFFAAAYNTMTSNSLGNLETVNGGVSY